MSAEIKARWAQTVQIEKLKTALIQLIDERPITADLLFDLVPKLGLNNTIPVEATTNFAIFFGGGIRYFFTLYENGIAYRICTMDESKMPTIAYVGYIETFLGEIGDGYTKLAGEYGLKNEVEIIRYMKPTK